MENVSSIFVQNAEQSLRFFRTDFASLGGLSEASAQAAMEIAMPGDFVPIHSGRWPYYRASFYLNGSDEFWSIQSDGS